MTVGRGDVYRSVAERRPGGGISIQDNVVIGTGAVVLFRSGESLVVGRGTLIGANSVVTRSVPRVEIWAGNVARRVAGRLGRSEDCDAPVQEGLVVNGLAV